MGWMDDFTAKIRQAQSAASDIGEFLKENVSDPLVKIGEAGKGNQSAEEIAKGQYGTPSNVIQVATNASAEVSKYLPLALLAGGLYFIFSKKRK